MHKYTSTCIILQGLRTLVLRVAYYLKQTFVQIEYPEKYACMDLAPQGPNPCIFFDFSGLGAVIGLKLTGRAGCVGLRQKSVDFPDIQKVETLILFILCLN